MKHENNIIKIIIDNGNDNDYHQYFKEISDMSGCSVFKIEQNTGKGNGIKRGISFLCQNYRLIDFVIFADADGQHTTNDILKFINQCNYLSKDFFLIGKREHNFKTPLKNRLGNLFYNFLINRKFNLGISDSLCGLRAIHFSKIDILKNLNTNQFDFEIESLIKIKNEKSINFKEVLISSTYFNNRKSNFSPITDSIKLVNYLYKIKK